MAKKAKIPHGGTPPAHADNDKALLTKFLDKTETVLQNVVDARAVLFRADIRSDFENAWPTVKDAIDAARVEVQAWRPQLVSALKTHGLTGAHLSLKLKGFTHAFNRFFEHGTQKFLKYLLSWINGILDSLEEAIPGLGLVKEFKDAAELELAAEDPN